MLLDICLRGYFVYLNHICCFVGYGVGGIVRHILVAPLLVGACSSMLVFAVEGSLLSVIDFRGKLCYSLLWSWSWSQNLLLLGIWHWKVDRQVDWF